MKKILLICLLSIGFCNHAAAQYNNFNRGGWGNSNFNRQFYPTSSGMGRTPVRYYGNNNNQQGQQQNNGITTSTENRGSSLTFNNGYPYGQRQVQVGGYYRVDARRNIWVLVPRPGLLK